MSTVCESSMKQKFHPYGPLPFCDTCRTGRKTEFSFDCSGCLEKFNSPLAPGSVFAICRQWNEVQERIEFLCDRAIACGIGVNDRDALTDMTLLHYAIQAACFNEVNALSVIEQLIKMGTNPSALVRWTDMRPIHLAAFFGVPRVVEFLLTVVPKEIDERCSEFFGSTPLHLCCSHLAVQTAKKLLQAGANPAAKDNLGLTPLDIVQKASSKIAEAHSCYTKEDVNALVSLLKKSEELSKTNPSADPEVELILAERRLQLGDRVMTRPSKIGTLRFVGKTHFGNGFFAGIELDAPAGRHNGTIDQVTYFRCGDNRAEDFEMGERVLVGGRFHGTVRFFGLTSFAAGFWYGVELDKPSGRNDGSINDTRYFSCRPKHGIFAPGHKLKRLGSKSSPPDSAPAVEVDAVEVLVKSMGEKGRIRYIGPVTFAKGLWFGLEMDNPVGEHDGTVFDRKYFSCAKKHGLLVRPQQVQQMPRMRTEKLMTFSELAMSVSG